MRDDRPQHSEADSSVGTKDRWLGRLGRATRVSLNGLRAVVATQPAFRLELAVLAIAVPAALWLRSAPLDRVLLIGSWLLVLIVELLNSAIETVVDRIGPERHELSGRAKDIGSAAVFVAIVLAVLVWTVMLGARGE